MDIKQGHPEAIFDWFFDSDQGTDHRAQLLIIIYGSQEEMRNLARSCLERQAEFDDALGIEILFLFFDPEINARDLATDGLAVRPRFTRDVDARYLFSGFGEARPVPSAMLELGRPKFRSEQSDSMNFQRIAENAAEAHARSVPFFQAVFEIRPLSNSLILGHRKQRVIHIYDLGDPLNLSPDDMIGAVTSMRRIARHLKGESDLEALDQIVDEYLLRAAIRSSVTRTWDAIRATLRM